MHIMGIPEGEESEQVNENLFEKIIIKNFPNLVKEKVAQIQETQESSKHVVPKEAYIETHHN